jgi:Glycosyl hydrolase family 26
MLVGEKATIVRHPQALLAAAAVALMLFTLASCDWGAQPEQSVDKRSREVLCARSLALGAHIDGAPDHPEKIDRFAEMVGRQPSVVMWYQDWATAGVKEFDPARMDEVVERGAMPMVTWEPADYTERLDQPRYALKRIVAGDHDEHIRQWARDAAAWGKPFYLRFAHEMNGDWYPWSVSRPPVNGNESADEYINTWKHVHDIFEEEGATNVRWVWNPDLTAPDRPSYDSLYPGDRYVDWVGIDAYNWGTSQPEQSSWQTFPEIFDASYKEMDAVTDRPMMVGETASAESGGVKAAWIRKTLLTDIPSRYPQVQAVVWFHRHKEADWRVNSSEDSLEAYREVAASPLYGGRLRPSGLPDPDTDIASGPSGFTNSPSATSEVSAPASSCRY